MSRFKRAGDARHRDEAMRLEAKSQTTMIGAVRFGAALMVCFAVGACALPDTDSFRGFDLSVFQPKSTAVLREDTQRPISAEDLVDGSGFCAGGAPPPAPSADGDQPPMPPPAGTPLIAGGVGLQMTECDVVNRIGPPERVEIGQNERNERTATLTYIRGARPGIYGFVGGRLATIERAPEPPPAQRPARPQRPAQKRAAR